MQPEEPKYDDMDLQIAEYIHRYCGIPGCLPKHHLEEARGIRELVKADIRAVRTPEYKAVTNR